MAPWFGTGRWLLPFVLLAGGVYVERARGKSSSWELRLLGGLIVFIAVLGLIELLDDKKGGRIGDFVAHSLGGLITRPGAFVVLIGAVVGGLLIMLDVSLATLVSPFGRAARQVGTAIATPTAGADAPDGTCHDSGDRGGRGTHRSSPRRNGRDSGRRRRTPGSVGR